MSPELEFESVIDAPPEVVFDAFTSPDGQREFYGKDATGWIVDSRSDLRIGGTWSVSFGPSPDQLYRHDHVFEVIDRPHLLRLATTETRLDGSTFVTTTVFTFEARGRSTLMTMSQSGFPTGALRDEHLVGVPYAFERLQRALSSALRSAREESQVSRSDRILADARRLILHMSISLDGFVAHSDHGLGWLGPDDGRLPDHGDQRHRINLELLGQIGLIVLGRRACEDMARGWPGSDTPMGRLMNTLPKVVFSQSLCAVEWSGTRISRRPIAEEIPELKAEGGKDMVFFGGARLGQSLIRERPVDELRLTVHPVALGEGLPLLAGLPEPQRFELVSATVYADGSIAKVLRPT